MNPLVHAARVLLLAAGAAVGVWSLTSVRVDDWPVYAVFSLLSVVLFLPSLEILPRVRFAIAEMGAAIGFVYIGGLPVVLVHWMAPLLSRPLRLALQTRRWTASGEWQADHFFEAWRAGGQQRLGLLTEAATFSLGLAARYTVVTLIFSHPPPVSDPLVILAAEVAGYVVWGLLSWLPLYPDRPLLPAATEGEAQVAISDIALVVMLALTPFVFLITYGYRLHGLVGAAGWSLGALGLHLMLERLHQRRLRVVEQNRRLEALNRALEHRERLSAIGKMSSIVSHQILQQLGVIGIHADLIRHDIEGATAEEALAQARTNAVAIEGALRDVNRVLTDLLVFSRDLRLNLYDHSLPRLLDEVVAECGPEAARRRVRMRTEVAAPIQATFDKLKIKQAIANVLRNAIEVSPEGEEVIAAAHAGGGEVEITVADRGPGVAEADRESVFAPFFTTKEQGTGLGLAIARAFVEAHGGRIWVERRSGGGAAFKIRLPSAGPAGTD